MPCDIEFKIIVTLLLTIYQYVVHNGMIKDMSVLMESPFTDRGSITDIFNASVWMGIKKVIDQINANANANVA